jgi:glycosyltransferase involved in cell wall biosynthesis
MRIVFINHWAAQLGGAELSLIDIMQHAARRADVHLVTSESGPLIERAQRMGVTCRVLPCGAPRGALRRWRLAANAVRSVPALFSYAAFVIRLARLLRGLAPAVAHANVPRSHLALMLAARLGYAGRCCFHMREIFPRPSLAGLLYAAFFPRVRSNVIAISHAVNNRLPAVLARHGRVIHNGVSIPAAIVRLNATAPVRCICLGRIVPWKGCHLLIDAFARLRDRRPAGSCTLDLVGGSYYWNDDYRRDLDKRISSAGLADICRLHDHAGDPMAEFMAHDLFCIASFEEPFGRAVAEAHACGLPVAGFDSGGIGEIVDNGKTGLLVPYGDIGALAGAMLRLVTDPGLRRTMGAAARVRAQEHFNAAVQIPKIVDAIASDAL